MRIWWQRLLLDRILLYINSEINGLILEAALSFYDLCCILNAHCWSALGLAYSSVVSLTFDCDSLRRIDLCGEVCLWLSTDITELLVWVTHFLIVWGAANISLLLLASLWLCKLLMSLLPQSFLIVVVQICSLNLPGTGLRDLHLLGASGFITIAFLCATLLVRAINGHLYLLVDLDRAVTYSKSSVWRCSILVWENIDWIVFKGFMDLQLSCHFVGGGAWHLSLDVQSVHSFFKCINFV